MPTDKAGAARPIVVESQQLLLGVLDRGGRLRTAMLVFDQDEHIANNPGFQGFSATRQDAPFELALVGKLTRTSYRQ